MAEKKSFLPLILPMVIASEGLQSIFDGLFKFSGLEAKKAKELADLFSLAVMGMQMAHRNTTINTEIPFTDNTIRTLQTMLSSIQKSMEQPGFSAIANAVNISAQKGIIALEKGNVENFKETLQEILALWAEGQNIPKDATKNAMTNNYGIASIIEFLEALQRVFKEQDNRLNYVTTANATM